MMFACLLGSLRWFLVGACWTGKRAEEPTWQMLARALALSLGIDLLLTFGLASLGLYRNPLHLAILLTICAIGALRHRPAWRKLWPGLLGINALILLTMLLPNRMEWIVGGWDPGVYVNQGADIARTGSFFRDPEPFHAFLNDEDRKQFTRFREYNFLEHMIVVPLDPETQKTRMYFFPLYSSALASGYSVGGLHLACRMNFLFGGIGLFILMAALARVRWQWAVCVGVLTLAQPLWWYHLHFPTTEILMGCLFGCLLFFLPERQERQGVLACGWFLAATALCRIESILFSALLLALIALIQTRDASRKGLLSHWLLLAVMLVLGAGLSCLLSPDALAMLGSDVSLIFAAGGMALLGGLLLLLLPVLARWTGRFHREVHWFALGGLLLLVAYAWFKQSPKDDQPMIWQLKGMMWFITWPTLVAAVIGFLALEWKKIPRDLAAWLLMLAALAVMILVLGKIHGTWPWGARRYVHSFLPLLLVLGGWGLCHLRHVGIGLALLVLLINSPRIHDAWAVMYDDIDLSDRLAEVADQIDNNAIVVCDHFTWATALRFQHGLHVINGEQISAEPDQFQTKLDLLKSWPGEVVWVTSSAKELSVYAGPLDATLRWTGPAFGYHSVERRRYIGGFTEAEREALGVYASEFVAGFQKEPKRQKQFRVWNWKGHVFPTSKAGDIQINVGDESAAPHMGRGWSRPEGYRRKGVWNDSQWVKKLEADVHFELPAVDADYDCFFSALPMFDQRLRQNVGLYMNGHFVREWVCPKRPVSQVYTARLPAAFLKAGENTLTFRAGHLAKAPQADSRKLSLQVDRILMRKR